MTGLQHRDDYFESPPFVVSGIENNTGLHFDIDISANINNTKCNLFISEETNALNVDWIPSNCNERIEGSLEHISKSEGVLSGFL